MKILFVMLFSVNAVAANWSRTVDLRAGSRRTFEIKVTCEQGGFKCISIDGFDLDVYDLDPSDVLVLNAAKKAAKDAVIAQEAQRHQRVQDAKQKLRDLWPIASWTAAQTQEAVRATVIVVRDIAE